MAKFEDIIYNTTRGIYSVDDKLRIATLFIFCWKHSSNAFAELLYTNDYEALIEKLTDEHLKYEVDFKIRFEDKLIKECFVKTIIKVRELYDKEGFYKAIYEGDEYALAIIDVVNFKYDKVVKMK